MAAAKRLCPRAVILRGNWEHYSEYSRRFYRILTRHTPAVETVSIDEAYLDLTGLRRLSGPATDICHRIHREVREELSLSASIGLSTSRLVSKIASGCAKPAGMICVLSGCEARFLAPLPIERLPGIGEKSRPRFEALGLNTIGDLAGLDVRLLKAAFGNMGLSLHMRANGIDPPSNGHGQGPLRTRRTAKSVGRETTFQEDTADPALLEARLHYLTERAAGSLRSDGLLAKGVTVKLRYSDFNTVTRSITLPQPTDMDRPLYLAAADLFRRAFTRRVRVRLIGVSFQVVNGSPLQLPLFGGEGHDGGQERLRALCAGVDSIRERYGFDSLIVGRSMFLKRLLKSPFREDPFP
jgi:DNA polymerase-4